MRNIAAAVLLAGMTAAIGGAPSTQTAEQISPSDTLVYVGTYTRGAAKGIYLFKLQTDNPDNIALVPLGLAAETPNPSFFDIDYKRRLLFSVNEVAEFEGRKTGAVSAFSIDPATGKLTLLNQRSSGGSGPCHITLDRDGRNVLVANYSSGTVAVLPVGSDGRLGEPSSVVQHSGSSVNPQRQKGPHAHCTTLDPANRFAFACDLGIDKVLAYRFDGGQGKLSQHEPAFAAAAPGSGPRDMAFRPDGRFAYVGNELNSTVTAYAYDANAGTLKEVQTVSTVPKGFEGSNTIAEVAVHPSGKYLYASNRGHDSVVLFEIDAGKGTLTYVEEQSTSGKTPRHFGIEPSGRHLAFANQGSDTVFVARIDPATGRLKPSSVPASVPMPVFVQFLPPGGAAR